jgi:hypothetical protein
VNYSSGAPVRQPVPDLPENDYPGTLVPEETLENGDKGLASIKLIWANRGTLARVALYALMASTIVAFLIPSRYESVARLMPPENQSATSGLAMAAAAMSGAAGGLGGHCQRFAGHEEHE